MTDIHQEHVSCISRVPIFSSLSPSERVEIAHIATSRSFLKGETIYRAGDTAHTLYVLSTGRVKLVRLSLSGKEQVSRIIGPGEFLGELSLFASLPLMDHAQAMENCTMCALHGEAFKQLMVKYPSIAFKIMDEMARRLATAESRIEAISLTSVNQRLAQVLLDLSRDKLKFTLPSSKGDLASQLGMSQETLSRRLSSWQDEGFIQLQGHRGVEVLDRDRLEDILWEE